MKEQALPLHWSTRALERVSEAVDHLAQYDQEGAEAWVEGLFTKVEKVAVLPRMGRIVPELKRKLIREVFYEQYRVIYKIHAERVEVLTVRHMRQHFDPGELGEQGGEDV